MIDTVGRFPSTNITLLKGPRVGENCSLASSLRDTVFIKICCEKGIGFAQLKREAYELGKMSPHFWDLLLRHLPLCARTVFPADSGAGHITEGCNAPRREVYGGKPGLPCDPVSESWFIGISEKNGVKVQPFFFGSMISAGWKSWSSFSSGPMLG